MTPSEEIIDETEDDDKHNNVWERNAGYSYETKKGKQPNNQKNWSNYPKRAWQNAN